MREYLVLGTLEVRHDDAALDLGSPKQRAVLAVLVLARGAVVSTDRLIDAVWGSAPPSAALTSLQAYISNLRRALRDDGAPSPIERVGPGYRLDIARDRVDLLEFISHAHAARHAADESRWADSLTESHAALQLWRGGLLAEFGDADWVAVESAALAETRYAVRDAHITALLAAGDTGRALSEIAALRADEPLRDRGTWLHMVALYRAGRTTEALEVYSAHVRILDAELGLDPGRALGDLQAAILRHDPAIAAWPRAPHWDGAATVHVASVPTEISDTQQVPRPDTGHALIGRVAECARIARLFASDTRDPGAAPAARWLSLRGPAGIGKTRLAEEAASIAESVGEQVIWVRCPDADGIPAWWPMRQLCRALGVDPADVLSVPPGADADTARFVVYERLQQLIEAAAEQTPLTLIVDDVQWADAMSLGFLAYVPGVLRDMRFCLIATIREEESNRATARLEAAFARADGEVLVVPSLAEKEVARLVRQITDEDLGEREVHALAVRTGGNPLFVSEYARLAGDQRSADALPSVVRSVLDRRLDALEPAVREVIAHAAVIGDEIDIDMLAEAMDRDITTVADCLDEAVDERILITSPVRGGTVFAHALLREEAQATIRPLRRARIHARIADVVVRRGVPDAAARRAAHLLHAVAVTDPRDIVAACREAADVSTAQWDSGNAAHWLTSALQVYEAMPPAEQDIAERDTLLVDLLDALSRAGRAQSVLETVESRLHDAVRTASTETLGRLASVLLRSGGGWPWMAPWSDPGGLHAVLLAAERAVADDPASRARVLAALAIGHCYHPDAAVPAGHLRRAEALAADLDDPDLTADVVLARLITYSGVASHVGESLALGKRLLDLEHRQAPVDRVIADSVLTMAAMAAGDVAATETHLRRGILGSERLKLPILRAQLRWMEVTLAVWRGEFDVAREHFRTAVTVHEETELYVAGSGAIAMMALATEQGLLDDVVDTGDVDPINWARAMTEDFGGNQVAMLLCSGVAVAAGRAGDRDLAATMIDIWLNDRRPMVWTSLAQAVLLAHVVADLEMNSYATRFIDQLMPFRSMIATVGQVGCVGPVGLALAELLLLTGRRTEAGPIVAEVAALAMRTGGAPTALRCRLLDVRLHPDVTGRDAELADIERAALDLGLNQVADRARRLATGTPSDSQEPAKSRPRW